MTEHDPFAAPESTSPWPSGDCRIVAVIDKPIEMVRALLPFAKSSVFEADVELSPLRTDDAEDGLGPYEGFHVVQPSIGMVAFTSHKYSPRKCTNVLVDNGKVAVSRVLRQTLLAPLALSISWTHPDWDSLAAPLLQQG